ncbi:MAG: hypothetical protein OXD31_08370 [Chloroflexi bacterium]|nr:hypothetical protein [Chloroflexota bacterium]
MYNATGGESWNENDRWLSGPPIGEWDGVTTDDNGRVIVLRLSHNELSGEIPPELGNRQPGNAIPPRQPVERLCARKPE